MEQLRRSAVMAPPDSRFGTLTASEVKALCDAVLTSREESRRYKNAVAQLRQVLTSLDD